MLNLFSLLSILLIFPFQMAAAEILLREPKIVYMDGPLDNCRAGLKQSVEAITGLLLSHPAYGSQPYNSSRNCFLTLVVPLGYRIRLRALDFDVRGQWGKCEHEDTFHVFDFDQPLDPQALESLDSVLPVGGDPNSPLLGRILGQFCGKSPPPKDANQSPHHPLPVVLAESSHNALILWWHTEDGAAGKHQNQQRIGGSGEEAKQQALPLHFATTSSSISSSSTTSSLGFRLLWSAFRHAPSGAHCRTSLSAINNGSAGTAEFGCASPAAPQPAECIPAPLGCNSQPDCADASDLEPRLQLRHGCEHIPNDPLSLLTSSGPRRLLLCAALVLLWLGLCFGFCCCLIHFRRQRLKAKKRGPPSSHHQTQQQQQEMAVGSRKCQQNGRQKMVLMVEPGERGQMLPPRQFSSGGNSSDLLVGGGSCSQLPSVPPPCFSPPAVPSNRPPPAPFGHQRQRQFAAGGKSHHQQQRQNQQQRQRQSASSSSQSSSSQHHQQQHQAPLLLNSSGGTATTTAGAFFPQQQQRNNAAANGGGGGEYFYVQQQQPPGDRQQPPPADATGRRHLLL